VCCAASARWSRHGNSLRALIMVLEKAFAETNPGARTRTGVPVIYRLKPTPRGVEARSGG